MSVDDLRKSQGGEEIDWVGTYPGAIRLGPWWALRLWGDAKMLKPEDGHVAVGQMKAGCRSLGADPNDKQCCIDFSRASRKLVEANKHARRYHMQGRS